METKISDYFKSAVENVVQDGIITDSEKQSLKEIAERENIPWCDADVYLSGCLKKRKLEIENEKEKQRLETETVKNRPSGGQGGESWWKPVLNTVLTVGGGIISIWAGKKIESKFPQKK